MIPIGYKGLLTPQLSSWARFGHTTILSKKNLFSTKNRFQNNPKVSFRFIFVRSSVPKVCPEPVLQNANLLSIHRDSSGDNPRNSSAVLTFYPFSSNIFCFAIFIMTFPLSRTTHASRQLQPVTSRIFMQQVSNLLINVALSQHNHGDTG
jgi:hypothetical protein